MRVVVVSILAVLTLTPPALAAPATDISALPAGTYVLDKQHASLLARVRHMGLSRYTMRFNRFDAGFSYDPAAPMDAKVTVSVDAASLDVGDSGIEKLFASQFLDARDHPTITFASTTLTLGEGGKGQMTGDMTLRGVTRPVTFDVQFDGYDSSLIGGRRAGFSAVAVIDRTQFGSTFLAPNLVAKDVELIIEAEFEKK